MFKKYFSKKKLVCFDFDGLLVNTEPLHFQAYMDLFKSIDYPLHINFEKYCSLAHDPDRDLLEKTVKKIYPDFSHKWSDIRSKKTLLYQSLLEKETIYPMVGAVELLEKLQKLAIETCIVTNSRKYDVETIAKKLPFLKTIPKWITKDDYQKAKPSPEGYNLALKMHDVDKKEAIGLEDTKKGISALKSADMDFLLINTQLENEDHLFPTLSFFV